jgi:Amt family ammonium transporter
MGISNFIASKFSKGGNEADLTMMVKLNKRERWQLALTIYAGKLLGLFLVIVAMVFLPGMIAGTAAHAQGAPAYTPHETTMMNTANTIWTLVAAFLVFGMQPGFAFLEAGFARKKETVNVLMECIFDTCICGILFWAIGYSFMFSEGNGFIGYHWFFLQGAPDTYETTGIPILAHWIFQFAFADTTSLQYWGNRFYLSNHWSLGLGP